MTVAQPIDPAVIDVDGLDRLITTLKERGYRTRGPVVRDGAIVPGDLRDVRSLPIGHHDQQEPGRYRLEDAGDEEIFGWAVGPQSLKGEFFPPRSTLWRAAGSAGEPEIIAEDEIDEGLTAYIGARPCELVALAVLDRVLIGGVHIDAKYARRRRDAVIVVAECGTPSASCFCASMGSGPGADSGFDLSITEIGSVGSPSREGDDSTFGAHDTGAGGPRFVVRAGSPIGVELLEQLPRRRAEEGDLKAREAVLGHARHSMGRRVETLDLPAMLARNLDHPRWDEVANRCLSCGNCTTVCPTCFCSDVDDVSDLTGGIERNRRWSSCFELSHSYLHGGSVRSSTASRYRQWATHKLSTWHDQFNTSGCVGCGRCIAWCPVGIDITEEVAAIRATDGMVVRTAGPTGGDR